MYNSYSNIKELSEATIAENKKLKKELDHKLKYTHTGERKLWYKFQSISKQQFYFKILILIYYILILSFVLKEINNKFEDIYFLSKIVILLLVPFLLDYISIVLNYIISFVQSIPKLF
jgi:DNA topoisomerase VI subunit A